MFAELATLPVFLLIQDAPPPISPAVLVIIAILLIALFIWLLLRERRARVAAAQAAAARAAAAKAVPAPAAPVAAAKPVEIPNQAMRVGAIAGPAAEPAAAPVVDDLVIIEGIGPKIASVLNEAGVTSFAQLAAMDPAKISEILLAANLRLADPHSWPEQARRAANGDTAGLQALQDRLKGGREV